MTLRPAALAKLRYSERHAVALLRGGALPSSLSEGAGDFAGLRDAAQAAGLHILPVGATLVSGDEQALVGWIAAMQRSRVDFMISARPELDRAVCEAAAALDRTGHRLSYATQARATTLLDRFRAGRAGAQPGPQGAPTAPVLSPEEERVLLEVRRRGRLRAADLKTLGVARRVAWLLHERGLLIRIRFGVYALGPAATGLGAQP